MMRKVKEFIEEYGLTADLQSRYIDFVSETGELGKAILSSTDYGTSPLRLTEDIQTEAGDVLFSLLTLFTEMGIDDEQLLDEVLETYRARLDQMAG
ncbi:MAG: MazG-like family protein [Solobacterium sp.]|nr:MazG-like family protein [Solobacterium sp.]